MVDFRPFRALRYTERAGSAADLICPPYDVIGAEAERELLARSPYNFVRLELTEATDAPDPSRYAAAAAAYRAWVAGGVLAPDSEPAYYVLRQRFQLAGERLERYAVLGALRLEPLGAGVLPHEDTGAQAKRDRLALMEASAANFSPIMLLYRDQGRQMAALRARAMAHPPVADAHMSDGQQHTLWRAADERESGQALLAMAANRAYVADGHHRYETALSYAAAHPDPAAQFMLVAMIDFDDPGLAILPYHRVLRGLDGAALERVRERLRALFSTQTIGVAAAGAAPLEELTAQAGAEGLAFVAVERGAPPRLLMPAGLATLRSQAPPGTSVPVWDVEAWALQEAVLRPALGDGYAEHVTAVHDGGAALRMVASGEGQLALLIKGVPTDLFETVVGAGVRLPRKSTYFWPKLPSGLLVHALEGEEA